MGVEPKGVKALESTFEQNGQRVAFGATGFEVLGRQVDYPAGDPDRGVVDDRSHGAFQQNAARPTVQGVDRIEAAGEVEVDRVEVGADGMGIRTGQDDRGEVPIEHLHVSLIAHWPGVEDDWGTLGIEDHVSVEPDTVVEQQVEEAGFPGDGQGLFGFPQAVAVGVEGIDEPEQVASVHQVLVQKEFVPVTEGRVGTGHDEDIELGLSVGPAFDFLTQGVHSAVQPDIHHIGRL